MYAFTILIAHQDDGNLPTLHNQGDPRNAVLIANAVSPYTEEMVVQANTAAEAATTAYSVLAKDGQAPTDANGTDTGWRFAVVAL